MSPSSASTRRELDDAGLRPGKHGDLAVGIDARRRRRRGSARRSPRACARARGSARSRGRRDAAPSRRAPRPRARRTELGVAAAEVDERRAVRGGRGGHTAEQRDEVLRREPLEAGGPWTHPVIVFTHDLSRLGSVNLVEALAVEIGPRPAGTEAAAARRGPGRGRVPGARPRAAVPGVRPASATRRTSPSSRSKASAGTPARACTRIPSTERER